MKIYRQESLSSFGFWSGAKANEEGRDWAEAFKHNQIYVTTGYDEVAYDLTGCSMTQWNEDCEQIMAEAERILNEYNLYGHDCNTNVANSNQLVTVLEILKEIK